MVSMIFMAGGAILNYEVSGIEGVILTVLPLFDSQNTTLNLCRYVELCSYMEDILRNQARSL